MSQRLFNVGKVGLFVDAVALGKEKRRGGEEATVLKLTLRCEPFSRELAAAIDEGLGGDHNVLASIFRLNSPDPKPHQKRVNLSLDCPRQRMDLYASPDTESSRLCFDQVKVSGFYVRTQNDSNLLAAVFTAAFGPVGRDELEACVLHFRAQAFVSWHEAEPSLAFDDDDQATEPQTFSPIATAAQPMWDDADDAPASEVAAPVESIADRETRSRPTAKRGTKKKTKHDPEVERVAQVRAGRAKGKPNGAAHT